MSNQAQCSHSRVARIQQEFPSPGGGTYCSEHWECLDCNTRFWPESVDMHKIRLRDMFAAKAMQSFLDKVIDKHLVKYGSTIIAQVAESSYGVADLMLEARNKQI